MNLYIIQTYDGPKSTYADYFNVVDGLASFYTNQHELLAVYFNYVYVVKADVKADTPVPVNGNLSEQTSID